MNDLKCIMEADKKYFMNTFGDRTPVAFTHGKGVRLYDTEGKEYVDFLAGIAVNALGYGNEKLVAAIADQAAKLLHCSNIYYIEAQALLEEKLAALAGGGKVFFSNSGAEANEGAIKIARKYFYNKGEKKYKIISAKDSFHGRTLATLAATGQAKYQKPYEPLPSGFVNVAYNSLGAIKEAIDDETAAVMLEVIQGEAGVITGDPAYIKAVRELCDEHGLLLIFDEVQTGIGRLGSWFGFQKYSVKPDVMTLAKALGGGVPIGAVMAFGEAEAVFAPGDHGSTFGGNPLACAAAVTTLTIIEEENILNNVREIGAYFKNKLLELKADIPL